jgi:hypothetical protein
MRVVAFAPSLSAVEEDAGGVNIKGFPMTSCYVDNFPAQITVPMVIAVCALGGADYDPVQVIESFWLGIWTGASRYIHCDWLRPGATRRRAPTAWSSCARPLMRQWQA